VSREGGAGAAEASEAAAHGNAEFLQNPLALPVQSGDVTLDGGKVPVASPLETLHYRMRFLA
jgi:hypothetical protein